MRYLSRDQSCCAASCAELAGAQGRQPPGSSMVRYLPEAVLCLVACDLAIALPFFRGLQGPLLARMLGILRAAQSLFAPQLAAAMEYQYLRVLAEKHQVSVCRSIHQPAAGAACLLAGTGRPPAAEGCEVGAAGGGPGLTQGLLCRPGNARVHAHRLAQGAGQRVACRSGVGRRVVRMQCQAEHLQRKHRNVGSRTCCSQWLCGSTVVMLPGAVAV